jgi:hypothetical protein
VEAGLGLVAERIGRLVGHVRRRGGMVDASLYLVAWVGLTGAGLLALMVVPPPSRPGPPSSPPGSPDPDSWNVDGSSLMVAQVVDALGLTV